MTRTVQLPPRADAAPMTERQLQDAVLDLARLCGFVAYHPWLSVHSERGWPDLALAKPPRLVFAELKSERGKPTSAQKTWLELLEKCGQEVHLWKPSDLFAGRIAEVLSA